MLSDASPDEVARRVFAKLAPALSLDSYFHYLLAPDRQFLELQSCAGASPEQIPALKRLKVGEAVCGTVAAQCALMYVPHVQQRCDEITAFIRGVGIGCYLCFPLVAQDGLLGTFSFGTKTRATYNDDERELLSLVSQQVALAVARQRQTQKLKEMEKLAVAGRLAAAISHEINNPLEAVANALFLVQSQPQTPEAKRFLALATSELERAAEITKQSLGFHRSNSRPADVCVRTVIDRALGLLRSKIECSAIRLEVDVPHEATVFACSGELTQIVFNVVRNAVDALPRGGTISIRTSTKGRSTDITVQDSGPGVPTEHLSRIFEPFFTTKSTTGTGLGLWVVDQLVRKNGGYIQLSSTTEPPTGTSVCVSLPAAGATLAQCAV